MKRVLRYGPALVVLILAPGASVAQDPPDVRGTGVCTADNPQARQELQGLLTAPELADLRERTGLADAESSDARVLEDPGNTALCARLQRRIPREYRIHGPDAAWTATYFALRDRYVVTVLSTWDPDRESLPEVMARGQTMILDQNFNVLDAALN